MNFPFGGGGLRGSSNGGFSSQARQLRRVPMSGLDRDMLTARADRHAKEEEKRNPGNSSIFVVGLDLGQQRDPTALCVTERTGQAPAFRHSVRHLERFPLGTRYPEIVRSVNKLLGRIPAPPEQVSLVVDVTGPGAAVGDLFREAGLSCKFVPVLICSGRSVSYDEQSRTWHVSKHELVGALLKVVGTGRLAVAQLALAPILQREMATLSIKVTTAGGEQVEALRERDHDDVVLATAEAIWWGERQRRTLAITVGGKS